MKQARGKKKSNGAFVEEDIAGLPIAKLSLVCAGFGAAKEIQVNGPGGRSLC